MELANVAAVKFLWGLLCGGPGTSEEGAWRWVHTGTLHGLRQNALWYVTSMYSFLDNLHRFICMSLGEGGCFFVISLPPEITRSNLFVSLPFFV